MRHILPVLCLLGPFAGSTTDASPIATDLAAECRHGQVFLTWSEPEPLDGVRFRVLLSEEPIEGEQSAAARVVGDYIRPSSATDWWLDPETYGRPSEPGADGAKPVIEPEGWIIEEEGRRLDAHSGLFVHTVTTETEGRRYYAVLAVDNETGEVRDEAQLGVNSLRAPVEQQVAPIEPIWQGEPAEKPGSASGNGLPLDLVLHAKRGRGGMEWLAFGDAQMGWRDGLPFKFGARVTDGAVVVRPTDRTWIARMFPEGRDECQRLTPAIHTFWYGHNDRVFDPEQMNEGVCVNYSERRLLWIIDWVKRRFGTDASRTYCIGSSMGGCGTFSFAFRHPEIFAAVAPHVGIVRYAKGPGGDSEFRVAAYTGGLEARCNEGMTVGERLDSTRFIRQSTDDLPFLVVAHGRQDGSIPWWVNPEFYRAMGERHQGMIAAWNEGGHADVAGLLPPDIRERMTFAWLHRFALNRSYVAFTNCSADDDPGNGDASHGDPVGYLNRGLDFEVIADEPGRYETRIFWYLEPGRLPVTVDVTPRRVQGMQWEAGDEVDVVATDAATGRELMERTVAVDEAGLLTVTGVEVQAPDGTQLVLTPGRGADE